MEFNKIQKLFLGGMVSLMHIFIAYSIFFIVIFSNDLFSLCMMGVLLLIILFLNHVYGDCPISTIEEHYLDNSSVDLGNSMLPIKYDSSKRPEVTLQWIFIILVIALIKILIIFLKQLLKDMKILKIIIK